MEFYIATACFCVFCPLAIIERIVLTIRRRLLSVVIEHYLQKSLSFMEWTFGVILQLITMALEVFPNRVVLKGEG